MSRNDAISKLIWWYQRMRNRTDSHITCIPHSNRRHPHKTHSLQMKLDSSSKFKRCLQNDYLKIACSPADIHVVLRLRINGALPPIPIYVSSNGHAHHFLLVIQIHFRSRNGKANVTTEGRLSPAMSPIATDFAGHFPHLHTHSHTHKYRIA